jgi:hypothetical protein
MFAVHVTSRDAFGVSPGNSGDGNQPLMPMIVRSSDVSAGPTNQ